MSTHDENELPEANNGSQAAADIAENSENAEYHNGQIQYYGRWQDVLKLCCWNTLWTILTLGIFRFWAKTRMRRYIWSNIVIDGDALEYTGRGLELFLGFLIISVIFIPASLLLGFISAQLPPAMQGLQIIVMYAVILFLIFVAIYRATRYRMSRTFWRGIRGKLGGSSFKYALIGFGSFLAAILSLGILMPLSFITLTRYETNNTWIGDHQARFTGTFGPAFKKWILTWLLCLVAIAISGGIIAAAVNLTHSPFYIVPLAFIPYLVIVFGMAWYHVWCFRYQSENTTLAGLQFGSTLATGQYIKLLLRFLLLMVVAGIVFVALLSVTGGFAAFSILANNAASYMPPEQVLAILAPFFILMLLATPVFGILTFVGLTHPMLALHVSSLVYDGDIAELHQNTDAQNVPRTGEGLAEAFDLGGI